MFLFAVFVKTVDHCATNNRYNTAVNRYSNIMYITLIARNNRLSIHVNHGTSNKQC